MIFGLDAAMLNFQLSVGSYNILSSSAGSLEFTTYGLVAQYFQYLSLMAVHRRHGLAVGLSLTSHIVCKLRYKCFRFSGRHLKFHTSG